MARLSAILGAAARAFWRDLRTLQSITANNFFLFVLLLSQQIESSIFFIVIIGVLFLFPLAADPLRKVPPDRLRLWPLSGIDRVILRIASTGISPITWVTLALVLWSAGLTTGMKFAGLAIVFQATMAVSHKLKATSPEWNVLLYMPSFPGLYGELVRKDLRQMLSMFDPYIGLVLSVIAVAYGRFGTNADPAAYSVLTLVIVLSLSTYTHCLFGLDQANGIVRYRLLRLSGWQILLAKGIAYMIVLTILVLPLDPLSGIGSGLVALAIGQYTAVEHLMPQHRWRFSAGVLWPAGVIQVFCLVVAGTAVQRIHPLWIFGCLGFYLVSLWFSGRHWDRLMVQDEIG